MRESSRRGAYCLALHSCNLLVKLFTEFNSRIMVLKWVLSWVSSKLYLHTFQNSVLYDSFRCVQFIVLHKAYIFQTRWVFWGHMYCITFLILHRWVCKSVHSNMSRPCLRDHLLLYNITKYDYVRRSIKTQNSKSTFKAVQFVMSHKCCVEAYFNWCFWRTCNDHGVTFEVLNFMTATRPCFLVDIALDFTCMWGAVHTGLKDNILDTFSKLKNLKFTEIYSWKLSKKKLVLKGQCAMHRKVACCPTCCRRARL